MSTAAVRPRVPQSRSAAGPVCFGSKHLQNMSDHENDGQEAGAAQEQDPEGEHATESEHEEVQEKDKRETRVWDLIAEWDPTSEADHHIQTEIARIAKEKMIEGGILKADSLKKKPTDLSLWKQRDIYPNPETGRLIIRYRCPLSSRCDCTAQLKVDRTPTYVKLYMSQMHSPASHGPDKEKCKFLKFAQKEEVYAHLKVDPMINAANLRRNLHRTSPEKKIDAQHIR